MVHKTALPAWLNWPMSVNVGLFIGSVLLMIYARATSFIPTAEMQWYGLYAAVVIGLVLSVKVALTLITNHMEIKNSRAAMISLLLLAPIGIIFMWWLILVNTFSYWFTLSLGHSFEDVQIGIPEYKRNKWGICKYRIQTKDVIEAVSSRICISKDFYNSLPKTTELPFRLVGKRSFMGYAVVDVSIPNYVSATTSETKVIEKNPGLGNAPQDAHIIKIKYVLNPTEKYYLTGKSEYSEFTSSFKSITPQMRAILSNMKVGGTYFVQCPTLADCGLSMNGADHPNLRPYILEIELISSSLDGT